MICQGRSEEVGLCVVGEGGEEGGEGGGEVGGVEEEGVKEKQEERVSKGQLLKTTRVYESRMDVGRSIWSSFTGRSMDHDNDSRDRNDILVNALEREDPSDLVPGIGSVGLVHVVPQPWYGVQHE
jgi:hypothetical protein